MRISKFLVSGLLFIACLCLVVDTGHARRHKAVLSGKVQNVHGKPLVGLTIRLKAEKQSNRVYITQTNRQGFFTFRKLSSGSYMITIENEQGKLASCPVWIERNAFHRVEFYVEPRKIHPENMEKTNPKDAEHKEERKKES